MFFGSLYQGTVIPFVEGIKYGITIAKYEIDSQKETDDFLLMDVVSKDINYMESNEINLKTGDKALIKPNNISIIVHALPNKPIWWVALQTIFGLTSLSLLVLGVMIPFLVVKILRSLQHSEVFDRINLSRIHRIGLILLFIGIGGTLIQTINVISAQYVVDLENYHFTYSKVIDFNAIIMGVVILIMNEVLRIAIEIKEEQDLTI